jgi:hypothetical protein
MALKGKICKKSEFRSHFTCKYHTNLKLFENNFQIPYYLFVKNG